MSSKKSKKEKKVEVSESDSIEEKVAEKKSSKKEESEPEEKLVQKKSKKEAETTADSSEGVDDMSSESKDKSSENSENSTKSSEEDDVDVEPEVVEVKSKKKTPKKPKKEIAQESETESDKDQPNPKKQEEAPIEESEEKSVEDDDEEKVTLSPRAANRVDVDRLFFKVVECKGFSAKPKNYFVAVSINDKKAYKSSTTKKKTLWEDSGRLLPIPDDVKSLKVSLYSKGIFTSAKGYTTLNVKDLIRGYPYNRWYQMSIKNKDKGALHLQVMLIPPNEQLDGEFTLPLHTLIQKDRFDLFEDAVDEEFTDLEAVDAEGNTALHLAAQLGLKKYVKVLLKKIGKNASTLMTNKGNTALHSACLSNGPNTEVIQMLLKAKFDPSSLNKDKETPLHLAALSNNPSAIELLVEKGAKVNATDKDKNVPLVIALLNHAPEAVRALVRLNTNVYKKNTKDMTVWELAQRKDMVNTEPRKAFMEELKVHDPREFLYKRDFTGKIAQPGLDVHHDFTTSTQYTISVKKDMEVVLLITPEDRLQSDSIDKVAFVLCQSSQGNHKEPDFSRDAIAFGGKTCLKITLEPDHHYTVLPYVKNNSFKGKYTFVLLHKEDDDKSCKLKELKPWKYCETVEGRWKKKTAGGAQQNSTWLNNPQYELTLPQEDDVRFMVYLAQEPDDIQLRLPEGGDLRKMPYDFNIGFFLMDRGAAKVIDQTEKFLNARGTHKEFVIDCTKHNHLTIMPSTWNPGEESEFTLKVFCDSTITLVKK